MAGLNRAWHIDPQDIRDFAVRIGWDEHWIVDDYADKLHDLLEAFDDPNARGSVRLERAHAGAILYTWALELRIPRDFEMEHGERVDVVKYLLGAELVAHDWDYLDLCLDECAAQLDHVRQMHRRRCPPVAGTIRHLLASALLPVTTDLAT